MGYAAAVASAVLSSSKDVVSKQLAGRMDGATSAFGSFAYALPWYGVLLAALALSGRETVCWSLPFLGLLVLRSATDAAGETLKMHAFAHGDLSLVASFLSLSPLFLLLVSPAITGDHVSRAGLAGVLAVVAGSLVLVKRPADARAGWRGILLATAASFFFGLNSCFDRLAVQRGTPVFAGFAMTALSGIALLPVLWNDPRRLQMLRASRRELFLRGLLETGYMMTKLYALQTLQAPYVVGIQRLSLLVSIVSGRLLFGERELGRRLAAGACIVGGTLLILLGG